MSVGESQLVIQSVREDKHANVKQKRRSFGKNSAIFHRIFHPNRKSNSSPRFRRQRYSEVLESKSAKAVEQRNFTVKSGASAILSLHSKRSVRSLIDRLIARGQATKRTSPRAWVFIWTSIHMNITRDDSQTIESANILTIISFKLIFENFEHFCLYK